MMVLPHTYTVSPVEHNFVRGKGFMFWAMVVIIVSYCMALSCTDIREAKRGKNSKES